MSDSVQPWLHSPLAVIGMDCRLPGADGLEQFWQLLLQGGYAIERMPDSKLDRRLYYDPRKDQRGKTYTDVGGFVHQRELDWSILNIRPQDASQWDACHLQLCEVAARACLHAGYDPLSLPLRNAGVFIGHSGGTSLGGDLAYRVLLDEYLELLAQQPEFKSLGDSRLLEGILKDLHTAMADGRPQRDGVWPYVEAGFASGLISRNFGLTGPHMSIDAACASSLVALAIGAMSLASGQTEMAIVGGASYNKADSLVLFSAAQSCSAGHSRPFDQAADGLISSEGYVVFLIKRLQRALDDGDTIHAVIRGIGCSSDGRGRSLWAPRHEGQTAAIQRAYSPTVDPASVQMIEAHATSTQVGDATEMEALSKFYRPHVKAGQRIPVGSIKSNIGHTLETAGLAGLLKVVLAIRHGIIPPSINVHQPNESIPWQEIPFAIPDRAMDWPGLAPGSPRRAAVNAFGIGGLNVHVVVDGPPENSIPEVGIGHCQVVDTSEPIAIVGRGLVVPGANDLMTYRALLQSESPALGLVSAHSHSNASQIRRVNFEYDWRKHKVPPKQVAHANPLQFMLLEAAEQALTEAGLLNGELNGEQTAVVVGSIFGGDFGNALFAGLRLPEWRDRLTQVLRSKGFPLDQVTAILEGYEREFLVRHPALLDETGSFTSSTLASRIAKTFNLMGGAMAIDAGELSSLAALRTACWLLQSGMVHTVLCAAAQRALDRAALDNLRRCGRLIDSFHGSTGNSIAPCPTSDYSVGEGVVLLALKPLSQAKREGNPILGVIDSVSLESTSNWVTGCASSVQPTWQGHIGETAYTWSPSLRLTGDLQAAQALLDVVNASLLCPGRSQKICAHSQSGQRGLAQVTIPDHLPISLPQVQPNDLLEIRYWSSNQMEELKQQLINPGSSGTSVKDDHRFAAAIVSTSAELSTKARKLASLLGNPQASANLADQGILWIQRGAALVDSPRLAFIFSGQGSQYSEMFRGLTEHFSVAGEIVQRADEVFASLGQPSFSEMAWNGDSQLGQSIWHTQAALLVADLMVAEVLKSLAIHPQVICGHSYGEIPAMWAAGCLDLETAIHLTWHRCRCVTQYAPGGYRMLSIQADERAVEQIIAEKRAEVTISHVNAPLQTVVGGKAERIDELAQFLEEKQIPCRILQVPTAFHTAALQAAVAPFRLALDSLPIHLPHTALLSSVNNHFVADPDWIRDGLARQLTTPLRLIDLVKKLESTGITHLIEVGPQRILTRLARACTSEIQVFSSDLGPESGWLQPILTLRALRHLLRLPEERLNPSSTLSGSVKNRQSSTAGMIDHRKVVPITHFDATQARRHRKRMQSGQASTEVTSTLDSSRQSGSLRASSVVESLNGNLSGKMSSELVGRTTAEVSTQGISEESNNDVVNRPSAVPKRPSLAIAEIERLLIDFVVEQTGYPAEIVEMDADLEADLGIDSIKKAQLLGELRETFGLKLPKKSEAGTGKSTGNRVSLDSLRTLRQILALLVEQTESAATSEPRNAIQPSETQVGIALLDSHLVDSHRDSLAPHPSAATYSVFGKPSASIPTSNKPLESNAPENIHPGNVQAADYSEFIDDKCAIPVLGANYRNGFVDAIQTNLRALPSRTANGFEKLNSDCDASRSIASRTETPSAHRSLSKGRARQLASQTRLSEAVLSQFDERLLFESSWEMLRPGESDVSTVDRGFSVHWIAELHLPGWLVANYCRPIGIVNQEETQVQELVTPGCLSPMAIVNSRNVLIVTGSSRLSVKAELAERLKDLSHVSQDAMAGVIQNWSDLKDWWLFVGDSSNGLIEHFQYVNGKLDRTCFNAGQWHGGAHNALESWARIGWDAAQQSWVISARVGSRLSEPVLKYLQKKSASTITQATEDDSVGTPLAMEVDISVTKNYFSGFSALDLSQLENQLLPEQLMELSVDSQGDGVEQFGYGGKENGDEVLAASRLAEDMGDIAGRYVLRMMDAPQLNAPHRQPIWSGPAVIVGDNPVAEQLQVRLNSVGISVFRPELKDSTDEYGLAQWFTELSTAHRLPHLFITSPCDESAEISLELSAWETRRQQGLMSVYWLCQKWLDHVTSLHLTDDASLVAVSTMGGDFGLSGNLYSAEGGGINGLLKSMLIECWMQGHRTLPIKTIDLSPDQTPENVVECIWRELAIPSYDNEISYKDGVRRIVKAIPQSLTSADNGSHYLREISRGGTWICTGGARGITAYAIERLAAHYDLTVHLIGTALPPEVDPEWRSLDTEGLRQLKLRTMSEARTAGANPVQAWQDCEKQLEIDTTLSRLTRLGIRVYYHSCDVANRLQVSSLIERIRQQSGPIRGVLHGAGIGRDALFHRKQPGKVQQCISAKVDGALSLMAATWDDPLEAFIGFGSISGRFGANGHTDYSLANDMMCKLIDWFGARRPDVHALGFHWHAWGDVGMATKAETRLALEMINMQFMPAEEGVRHLMDELSHAQSEREVLITDDRYYRAFYPAETLVQSECLSNPLLTETADPPHESFRLRKSPSDHSFQCFKVKVNPTKDPFLVDHLLDGKPLLPFVIAAEMMAEAAAAVLKTRQLELRDIQAHSPIKFFSEMEQEIYAFCASQEMHGSQPDRDHGSCQNDPNSVHVELRSDFLSQKGIIGDRQRLRFSACVAKGLLGSGDSGNSRIGSVRLSLPPEVSWQAVSYPEVDSQFYVGWPLQRLRKVALLESGLVGRIIAPALIELAGVTRRADGWIMPSSALDACLFASGILAWNRIAPGSALPVHIGRMRLGRLPRPGEACTVHVAMKSVGEGSASFDFSLYGVDESLIVDATDYEVAWIGSSLSELDNANAVDLGTV